MKNCYNCFNEIPDRAGTCPNCGQAADISNAVHYPYALPCGSVLNGKYGIFAQYTISTMGDLPKVYSALCIPMAILCMPTMQTI